MRLFGILLLLAIIPGYVHAEGGMYPLSDLKRIEKELKKAGLQLKVSDLYDPNGVSLMDALVNVGGCSGAFVSPDGLIITNHHCAFGAVQAASSVEQDYITNGFRADSREMEIEAKGLTIRITKKYMDVSDSVNAATRQVTDPVRQEQVRNETMSRLEKNAAAAHPGLTARVAEMLAGKVYVLFLYEVIRDVRLVYVPPRSIGEFGGETDNWVWPRHTGDFAFLRAYVGPDGKPASYSEANIPFKPKKHLKVNPDGAKEGDFVFILGYPGRTYRHQPVDFVDIQKSIEFPYVTGLLEWQIRFIEAQGESDAALKIQQSARAKSLANVMKRQKGQLTGMDRLQLVENRRKEEDGLISFIGADKNRLAQSGQLADSIRMHYQTIRSMGILPYWSSYWSRSSAWMSGARVVNDLMDYEAMPDSLVPARYKKSNYNSLQIAWKRQLTLLNPTVDQAFIKRMLVDYMNLPETVRGNSTPGFRIGLTADQWADSLVSSWFVTDQPYHPDSLLAILSGKRPASILKENAMVSFTNQIFDGLTPHLEKYEAVTSALVPLQARWVTLKQNWKGESFIPDANGTIRLTYGSVKGYYPADGVYYKPVTTLRGIPEKAAFGGDYEIPQPILNYFTPDKTWTGNKQLGDLPVAILYNTDTTGGNSGSSVLNSRGELVAVNFDRAWEATINDYAWSDSYSRSIGVDIRYILWVTETIGNAGHLLKEMGVK